MLESITTSGDNNAILDTENSIKMISEPNDRESIDTYWKVKEKEFENKFSNLLTSIRKMLEEKEEEKERFQTMNTQHNEIMKDMIAKTIENCNNIKSSFEIDVETKCSNLFTSMSKQLSKDQEAKAQEDVTFWQSMKHEMKQSYARLADTNKIILKNNDILTNKLKRTEQTIANQMNKIDK